jgi:hypothetical protein
MSSPQNQTDQVRFTFEALRNAVREMTAVGAKAIPINPRRFNLLARPHTQTCNICKYPGHQSNNVNDANACRVAIMGTVGFWEDMAAHISYLYSIHENFHNAINANNPVYKMRLDNCPPLGSSFEEIFVNRLTRNYLKFQSHFASIRPKAQHILSQHDQQRYENTTKKLNDFLLKEASRMLL